MIFNVEELLAEKPAPSAGHRLVPVDLFISHRRADSPEKILTALSGHDVTVTWDQDLDMNDGRVVHAITRAMQLSRHVGLYVSNGYTDSLWCRAEYLSATSFESHSGYQRALVILDTEEAASNVPHPLRRIRLLPRTRMVCSPLPDMSSRETHEAIAIHAYASYLNQINRGLVRIHGCWRPQNECFFFDSVCNVGWRSAAAFLEMPVSEK